MKKIVFALAIAALVISVSSCGNKKQKTDEHVGTHTHEDGKVYSDDAHDHSKDALPAQESFEVKADDNDAVHNEQSDAKHEGHDHSDHDHDHGEHN